MACTGSNEAVRLAQVYQKMVVITSFGSEIPANNILLCCVVISPSLALVRLAGVGGLAWLTCACQLIIICRVPCILSR